MGFFETCKTCTEHARQWQVEMRACIKNGEICAEAHERSMLDMLAAKRTQVVRKGYCFDPVNDLRGKEDKAGASS